MLMNRLSKNRLLLLIVPLTILLAACNANERSETIAPAPDAWPDSLSSPIEGATFSVSRQHLPGAPREFGGKLSKGFDFFNGYSGRPLATDEAVVSVASGEIVRIDHFYEDPDDDSLLYWADLTAQPGFARDHALDQLHGRQVWVLHEGGHVSRYSHLSMVNPNLEPGSRVEQGQPIGLIGNSGIPPIEDQPEPDSRLNFQLWSPNGQNYLGQDLEAFQIQQALKSVFDETALVRGARTMLAEVAAGAPAPESWPPEGYEEAVFEANIPESIVAGSPFTIGINWPDGEFLARELMAALDTQTLGVLSLDGGAAVIGVPRLDQADLELAITLGAIDQFGNSLIGSRMTRIKPRPDLAAPLEVDVETFAAFNQGDADAELDQIRQATALSLSMLEPEWQKPFAPPLAGDVVGRFGQKIVHDETSAEARLPGILIFPASEPEVRASNDGFVHMVGEQAVRGRMVAISHGGGVVSVYSRLGAIGVTEGERVTQGQQIGILAADGPIQDRLLLWEMHVAGVPSDPLEWMGRALPGQGNTAGRVQ